MNRPPTKIERMEIRWAGKGSAAATPRPRRTPYLTAYACFGCAKSWKLAPRDDGARCPQCSGTLADMGRSFKAPKAVDADGWAAVRQLWNAGFRFNAYRSHPDAERLPVQSRDVADFIRRNPKHPLRVAHQPQV